jgi:hypothetical protein
MTLSNVNPLQATMDTWISSAQNENWSSFSLAKLIISIASASGYEDEAVDFAKKAIRFATPLANYPASVNEDDVLSLIRAFTQGDGIVSKVHRGGTLSKALLPALLTHCKPAAQGLHGPMKMCDFFTNFWVLAHKQRFSEVSSDLLTESSKIFQTLTAFSESNGLLSMELRLDMHCFFFLLYLKRLLITFHKESQQDIAEGSLVVYVMTLDFVIKYP